MKRYFFSLIALVSFIGVHIPTANAEDAGIFVPAANAKIAGTIVVDKITSNSAEILWVSYGANTNIKWGDDVKQLSSQVTANCTAVPIVANQHCRKLENLKANSTYYFRIPTSNGYNGFLYLVGGSFVTRSDDTSTAVASSTITVDRMPEVTIIVSSSTPADYAKMQAIVTSANNKTLENSQKHVAVTKSSETQVESKGNKPVIASTSLASSTTETRPGFLMRMWSFVISLFN